MNDFAKAHTQLILDGTKIAYHQERLEKWKRGERFAPITIDMALTRACNYRCHFCYAMMQDNDSKRLTQAVLKDFIDDCVSMDVKGISLVSDGESTISPHYDFMVRYGAESGLSMASGTNGFLLEPSKLARILPFLTYLRFNFSAGDKIRYAQIMGTKPENYDRVCSNVRAAMEIKTRLNLKVTIGLQMVLTPQDGDQILPMALLGRELGVDYLIIKHCSDDEDGTLGVKYEEYEKLYPLLKQAESYSSGHYKVYIKWTKIKATGKRIYQRCYGTPFLMQLSGSGLVAPCGMLFNTKYSKYHIGNIVEKRFKEIVFSDRYWEVVNELASPRFDAQKMCGSLCLQHKVNEYLDSYKKGEHGMEPPTGVTPPHINFV